MKGKLGGKILVSCTKGILQETLETVDDVLERVLSPEVEPHLAFLSGQPATNGSDNSIQGVPRDAFAR